MGIKHPELPDGFTFICESGDQVLIQYTHVGRSNYALTDWPKDRPRFVTVEKTVYENLDIYGEVVKTALLLGGQIREEV